MKVFEIPGSRDAVPQSSQQVNISSAQPKHNVCSSPPTHPAVMAGQVQLQAAKENSGTTSNYKRKPELDDPKDPKKPWKQKLKLSARSPARYTHLLIFLRRFTEFTNCQLYFIDYLHVASIQTQTNPDRPTDLQQRHKH